MAWLCVHVVTQCYVLAAKTRGIAIPSDLEHLVTKLFSQQHILIKSSRMWLRTKRESSCSVLNHDYKTIIEGLQVRVRVVLNHDYKTIIEGLQVGARAALLP